MHHADPHIHLAVEANLKRGGNFFDDKTLRFFGSRLLQGYQNKRGNFVYIAETLKTSFGDAPRGARVIRVSLKSGEVQQLNAEGKRRNSSSDAMAPLTTKGAHSLARKLARQW